MIITAEQILSWSPCSEYSEARIRELVVDGVTPQQIAESTIPRRDRYWVLLRLLSSEDQRLLAATIAERALMAARVRDPRSWAAVRVARLYAMGEAGAKELATAYAEAAEAARVARAAAAWEAASWAARAAWAAWEAAVEAVRATAEGAAWEAAEGAVWATAEGAVWAVWEAAAWAAEAAWSAAWSAVAGSTWSSAAAGSTWSSAAEATWKAAIDDAMRLLDASDENE